MVGLGGPPPTRTTRSPMPLGLLMSAAAAAAAADVRQMKMTTYRYMILYHQQQAPLERGVRPPAPPGRRAASAPPSESWETRPRRLDCRPLRRKPGVDTPPAGVRLCLRATPAALHRESVGRVREKGTSAEPQSLPMSHVSNSPWGSRCWLRRHPAGVTPAL